MAMLQEDRRFEAREAEENLRVIRGLMERSTKYSTFSGLSGILAGLASVSGCAVTRLLSLHPMSARQFNASFLTTWALVVVFAIGMDYLLTKRRAARVGKHILSRLGKQMFTASVPGLATGAMLSLFLLRHGLLTAVYPLWMLSYGVAVCAVGVFSQREVSVLGFAFLVAGAVTLLLPGYLGLVMMAVTFGGFHVAYGLYMSSKDGW